MLDRRALNRKADQIEQFAGIKQTIHKINHWNWAVLTPKNKSLPPWKDVHKCGKTLVAYSADFSRRLFRRVDILCTCSFQRESHDQLMDRQLRSTSSTASSFFFISLFCFIYMNSFKTLQTTDFIFFLKKKKIHEIKIL